MFPTQKYLTELYRYDNYATEITTDFQCSYLYQLLRLSLQVSVNTYSVVIFHGVDSICNTEILQSLASLSCCIFALSYLLLFPISLIPLTALLNLDSSVRKSKIEASPCLYGPPWILNYWGVFTIKRQPSTRSKNTASKQAHNKQAHNKDKTATENPSTKRKVFTGYVSLPVPLLFCSDDLVPLVLVAHLSHWDHLIAYVIFLRRRKVIYCLIVAINLLLIEFFFARISFIHLILDK
jgi:hypothetical protein